MSIRESGSYPTLHRGLDSIYVDNSAISEVNPETNSLLYQGYPAQKLATSKSFEEVAYLLWHGELPNKQELVYFQKKERAFRFLDPKIKEIIDLLPEKTSIMSVLRTIVSFIGTQNKTPDPSDRDGNLTAGIRLMAQIPIIIAYEQRRRHKLEIIPPDNNLDYCTNFLFMVFGKLPKREIVSAFNASMVLYAEHSFNASTFTARVIASTLSDIFSAVTGAIGALKGPLHGGANERVVHALKEIGSVENVDNWLDSKIAAKDLIMGFGHRVYKNGDSRVPTMEKELRKVALSHNANEILNIYTKLEQHMYIKKGLRPNLDYPAGLFYHLIGFNIDTFTPLFVASRVVGWTAHIIEQYLNNILIRPLAKYNGVSQREVDD